MSQYYQKFPQPQPTPNFFFPPSPTTPFQFSTLQVATQLSSFALSSHSLLIIAILIESYDVLLYLWSYFRTIYRFIWLYRCSFRLLCLGLIVLCLLMLDIMLLFCQILLWGISRACLLLFRWWNLFRSLCSLKSFCICFKFLWTSLLLYPH